MIVPRQDATFDLELNDGKFQSAVLCRQLLRWWQFHGRKDASLKPWMFTADGRWPAPNDLLAPYPVLVAEVIHCGGAARDPKIHNLFQIADVDSGVIRWVNADLVSHILLRELVQ